MDLDAFFAEADKALDERSRRIVAAALAKGLGFGGISGVSRASGLARTSIYNGLKELDGGGSPPEGRLRKEGGGRKLAEEKDDTLLRDLEALAEPHASGLPTGPLRWVNKSLRILAGALNAKGHRTSRTLVGRLLKDLGYTLQSNMKSKEPGSQDPDRNAQFERIAEKADAFQAQGLPVISVDAKKKELVGDFKNNGRTWRPKGEPEEVRAHDFIIPELGRATPYGVYDVARDEGWVGVGIDHDTAEFAVSTIRQWWRKMGEARYPDAKELFITADSGGSNGSRSRLWKRELQKLSNETGLSIHVSHLPPGTSKWNKIEHRMFSFISMNWRGRPLTSYQVIVNLIGSTRTKAGLRIAASLDKRKYQPGIKVSNAEREEWNIQPLEFRGDWNYVISPLNS